MYHLISSEIANKVYTVVKLKKRYGLGFYRKEPRSLDVDLIKNSLWMVKLSFGLYRCRGLCVKGNASITVLGKKNNVRNISK